MDASETSMTLIRAVRASAHKVFEAWTGPGPTPPVQAGNRLLATVLFVDIVDSTRRAIALGDRRWAAALSSFLGEAALQVERHGGRPVNTTGDGLVATLDRPARAIRCACAIRDGARTADLEVRCGLHTAEIERRGDDIAGIGVHTGARISELADPGEVWVSRTVKDLVAGSGVRLEGRGAYHLKGLDEDWMLYAATV